MVRLFCSRDSAIGCCHSELCSPVRVLGYISCDIFLGHFVTQDNSWDTNFPSICHGIGQFLCTYNYIDLIISYAKVCVWYGMFLYIHIQYVPGVFTNMSWGKLAPCVTCFMAHTTVVFPYHSCLHSDLIALLISDNKSAPEMQYQFCFQIITRIFFMLKIYEEVKNNIWYSNNYLTHIKHDFVRTFSVMQKG